MTNAVFRSKCGSLGTFRALQLSVLLTLTVALKRVLQRGCKGTRSSNQAAVRFRGGCTRTLEAAAGGWDEDSDRNET